MNKNCEFCGKTTRGGNKRCSTCSNHVRRIAMKSRCVEYKGGKCVRCGWNKHHAALQFHHLNPNEKEFGVCESKGRSWDKIKDELDKCILLCANCHFIEHAVRYTNELLTEAAKTYRLCDVPVWGNKDPIGEGVIGGSWNRGRPNVAGRKVERPSKDALSQMLWEKPTSQIAKNLGVSDVAISKWAKSYGLAKPPRGYWAKLRSLPAC